MITRQEAERIAAAFLGHEATDASGPWDLVEFDQGWLIDRKPLPGEPTRGAPSWVIERADGRLMVFSSGISSNRIISNYEDVRRRGSVEEI
jgi:hypothetical protein